MIPAAEALERLREGNRRFAAGSRRATLPSSPEEWAALAKGQQPFAIILGCSDSRVPAEIVFDQGLGDLFVIRVAGNIVAPSQIGSVEFAAERFGTRLVVIMAHTQCGAIEATIEAVSSEHDPASRNILSIVNRMRPNIESLVMTDLAIDPVRLRREATRAHVRACVNHLRHGSEIIERLADKEGLVIIGAELELATGQVTFFEEGQRQPHVIRSVPRE